MQEETTGMREKEINIMEWICRGKWRRKIGMKNKEKTSKFLDAGRNNWNEREGN